MGTRRWQERRGSCHQSTRLPLPMPARASGASPVAAVFHQPLSQIVLLRSSHGCGLPMPKCVSLSSFFTSSVQVQPKLTCGKLQLQAVSLKRTAHQTCKPLPVLFKCSSSANQAICPFSLQLELKLTSSKLQWHACEEASSCNPFLQVRQVVQAKIAMQLLKTGGSTHIFS